MVEMGIFTALALFLKAIIFCTSELYYLGFLIVTDD